jgi:hypothetical protein
MDPNWTPDLGRHFHVGILVRPARGTSCLQASSSRISSIYMFGDVGAAR